MRSTLLTIEPPPPGNQARVTFYRKDGEKMCTDFLIGCPEKGIMVNGRGQDWDSDLTYKLMLRMKGEKVEVKTQLGSDMRSNSREANAPEPRREGREVKSDLGESKYDYIGFGLSLSTAIFDGMNSAGLSAGLLYAGGSRYQKPNETAGTKNVFIGFVIDWLLSNYASCKEVRGAFETDALRVVYTNEYGATEETINAKLGEHITVHDASGESIVIEFINGEAKVSNNPVAVLTNLPEFSWHLTNLGTYTNLTNIDIQSFKFGDWDYTPPGHISTETARGSMQCTGIPGEGSGLRGLPGDYSPPSRFVRVSYLLHFSVPPTTADDAVSQAFHLLNSVDVIKGSVATPPEDGGTDYNYDYTQIQVVKDIARKLFFVRLHESPMPYVLSFKIFDELRAQNLKDGRQIDIPSNKMALDLPLA
jgi:choloylglycine hydrolase